MEQKKVLIIGAGPAGLTAAYEILKHTNYKPIVLEMSDVVGGISRTVNHHGNRIDIGGHRFFSKSDVVMNWWNSFMPIFNQNNESFTLTYHNQKKEFSGFTQTNDDQNVMLIRKRKSRIIYGGKFYNYPISLSLQTINNLGYFRTLKIGFSYLKSVLFPVKDEKTLEDFFINRFGKELYQTFFKDYTEKVWGISCNKISSEWGAQRIKGLSIRKTILHFLTSKFKKKNISQKGVETSLIEYFLYPKYGPGQMWECVTEKVIELGGDVLMQHKVTQIVCENNNSITQIKALNLSNQKEISFDVDYCISTMPIDELIQSLNTIEIPDEVKEVSRNLQFRDFITVGLLLKKVNLKLDDNWIYVQEPSVKVGRIQIFNNWSPYLVHDKNTYWLGLEYFCNKGDILWNKTDEELKKLASEELVKLKFIDNEDVIDAVVIRMPKTYPAYFGSYEKFDVVKRFTVSIKNLYLIGRNGMHKYNNQDHSMLTAMEAVQLIKTNNFSKESIWSINTEQEYHEEK